MELQFNKTVIPCLRTVAREMQTQEQTQEVRLTDGMPDIGRVLASWGQILIRGKEWRSGSAGVSGGVMVWVLYAPEDGSEPRSVEAWLPFQTKWSLSETERDGTLCVQPILQGVDARSLSARKLMVRAGIGMLGQAMVPGEAEIYSSLELPEDVHILKNTYPMQIPVEAGEKAFNVEETLSLPASVSSVDKLIRYTLRPELAETKVLGDKAVIRGTADLELLYQGTDGQLHSWNFEIPFSQYAQLDKDYGTEAQVHVCLAVTALELEQSEEENLNLKAGLTGQYVITDRKLVEVVEDVYSPLRSVTPQISGLQLPTVMDSRTETLRAEQAADTGDMRVIDAVFYMEPPQQFRDGDKVAAELAGSFQTLSYDPEGQLRSDVFRWQDQWSVDAADNVNVQMWLQPTGKIRLSMGGAGTELNTDLLLNTAFTADQGIPMVTAVELGQQRESDPNRPSLILCRVGNEGLWGLAKRTGSTVEAIRKANDLSREPDNDQMLLIPVS